MIRKNKGHYSYKSSVGEVDILLVFLSWSHETHEFCPGRLDEWAAQDLLDFLLLFVLLFCRRTLRFDAPCSLGTLPFQALRNVLLPSHFSSLLKPRRTR